MSLDYSDENIDDSTRAIEGARVRTRISLDKTIKDGWRFASTVEVVSEDNPEAVERMLTHYLRLTDDQGRSEVDARNESDEGERNFKERYGASA